MRYARERSGDKKFLTSKSMTSVDQHRPPPRRGQVKAAIASSLVRSFTSAVNPCLSQETYRAAVLHHLVNNPLNHATVGLFEYPVQRLSYGIIDRFESFYMFMGCKVRSELRIELCTLSTFCYGLFSSTTLIKQSICI
ncbi:hypothetical protein KP509_07G052100 [Ceratopteris richardii]|uniref:Uncharacterized protein n=1 Tax=Ceratopteris richardii TaxID=49495 RepID=A0A8T2UGR2_CERRI|nr:hypothetical protein KP509_07G052100 [Ceratopteris richardii]